MRYSSYSVHPRLVRLISVVVSLFLCAVAVAAPYPVPEEKQPDIKGLVAAFKKDPRGPYQAIRWFCKDGSVLPAKQRCPQPGGLQHALHKDVVVSLASANHLFLGQILAGTSYQDFLDAENRNSRLKQYQIEKYLQAVDNGWILRQAQFYRGAFQAEDEERWGSAFLRYVLADDVFIRRQFLLARQMIKDLPYQGAQADRWGTIRQLARKIAEREPAFTDLRVKLHGQPSAADHQLLKNFRDQYETRLSPEVVTLLDELASELAIVFQPLQVRDFSYYEKKLPSAMKVSNLLQQFLAAEHAGTILDRAEENRFLADLLLEIRQEIITVPKVSVRLTLLELSNEIERILLLSAVEWQPSTQAEMFLKFRLMTQAAAACGFLELWEWQSIQPVLETYIAGADLSPAELMDASSQCRRIVEWSSSTLRAVYRPELDKYAAFEPLAAGFFDDRIRASILLDLGRSAGRIAATGFKARGIDNMVMGIENGNEIRGLNPGFTMGELEVVTGEPESITFSENKIYVLAHPPADMKPVAGIATVTEGNLVSHIQLLARNLGIPNAVLSDQNVQDLLPFSGRQIFYAVSPRGRVVLKLQEQMTAAEKSLFDTARRPESKIRVPVERLELDRTDIISLQEVTAVDSGRICGPKAANLGQLKNLFPMRVANGLVIPFGIFRQHLDQPMPGTDRSYWQFLQETFQASGDQNEMKGDQTEREEIILHRLLRFREAISSMPLHPKFIESLKQNFTREFHQDFGDLGVFIRSDTNMEDLKDFTGAGLNLTVFNVRDPVKILQSILDVWASPFTERSYRWRQKLLENPENVFPSILILPSIAVDKSGVMITTGLAAGKDTDTTVAFSRGVGGAVEGQAAETWLLSRDGSKRLLAPARETLFTSLAESGGVEKKITFCDERLLGNADLALLAEISEEIRQRLPGSPGMTDKGPFDVELGILDGRVWLFQARPFVENRNAKSSGYLKSLDSPLSLKADKP